jgi:hypothetical protein
MDFLHDLGCGLLMLFVGFIVFDWGRIWWHARRHGYISLDLTAYSKVATRWEHEYLGYKVWTWLVRIATVIISVWHLTLGTLWLAKLTVEVWS